jgi:hypothetical protein
VPLNKIIQLDKVLHFIVGAGIFSVLGYVLSSWVAAIAVCVAAIGKEIYDTTKPDGVFDRGDIVATLAGGVVAMAFMVVISWQV